MTISIIIITLNAERHIRRCLSAVRWADEIIVVDSGSTDQTVAICQEFTSQLHITSDWPGFGSQKNRALAYAKGDWILNVDADEIVSPELADAIQLAIQHNQFDAYLLPFLPNFCGHWIKHGDWGNEQHLRLFKRTLGRFDDAVMHERLLVDSQRIGQLKPPIYHYTVTTADDVLDKINRYSTAAAQRRLQQGKKGGFAPALLHSSWAFFRSYLLKRGFLDGKAGFMVATALAVERFYRYLKLAEMQAKQCE